ncbi:MAG: response regulator [Desulfobaccales bacterium]
MATILVVDDRAPDRELLSLLLSHGRHRVLEAADGAEALRLLRAEHPDLVISDVLLPKMDGYELVRQMHLDPAISETSIIFYTAAFNEQEARDLARECGVSLILSKPTDPTTILEKVTEVLNGQGAKGVTSLPAAFEEKHQELLIDKLMRQVEELQRSEERLQAKTQILTGINRVFHEALTSETEEKLARTCLDVAKGLTGSRFALLGKVNQARKLDIVFSDPGWASCRLPGSAKKGSFDSLPHIHGYLEKVMIQGRSLIANDPAIHPEPFAAPPGYPPLSAFLGVPLKYAGQAIGIIALGKIAGGYDSADQEAVENLSFAIVEAFLRQRAEQGLRRAHDELEQRVRDRTAELKAANQQLNQEIEVRLRVEETLRESREKLRFLTSQLLHAQETERKRISYELHDDLGQSLTALKMQLRWVEKKLPPGGMKEDLGHSLDYINEIIENVRRLSQDLRPSVLEHMGIAAALRYFFDEFTKYSQIPVTLDMDSIQGLFSAEVEVIIYRIIQESFTNIAKHAQAALVTVDIKRLDGQVKFRVEDNGRGFDSHQILNQDITKRGLGLSAMAERMRMLNGSLDIWSQEDRGTRISFTVPVMGQAVISDQ